MTYEGNTYSVTSIGNYAFYFCHGLTELTIPNNVTDIGSFAFHQCHGLTELTIPSSVTSIGTNPFRSCDGLEKIIVESDNPNYDSRENCNAIINTNTNELITGCKNTIILNSVTFIGNQAFSGLDITELTIPNSVTSIGDHAFYQCLGLTEVTIPNSVTSIGKSAFWNCAYLERVTIGNSVASIGDEAFDACYNLITIYSLNTTPPSISTSTFDIYDYYRGVDLFVPEEALEAYQIAEVWKDFERLQAINGSAAVTEVNANAEQIQSANGQITVTGLTDGTTVAVYDLSGQQVGTDTSMGGQATVSTGLTAGAAAIVKMGDNKSVKVVVK